MTDEVPEEGDVTPGEQAYRDAYAKEASKHTMTPVGREPKDRRLECSCGETGDATDMAGHWGPEADRAGAAAQAKVELE